MLFWLWQIALYQAQPPTNTNLPKPPPRQHPLWRPTDYTWIQKDWVEGSPRYAIIRQNLDVSVSRGEVTKQTLNTYEDAFTKTPSDKVTFFRWAYASYKAGRKILPSYSNFLLLRRVDEALAKTTLPYPREFARLRFLVEAQAFPEPKIASVGERLLATDAQDRTVKAYLAQLLSFSRVVPDKEKALKYAQELLGEYPNEPAYHLLVGNCYDSFCWANGNPRLAVKAIAEYEIYMRSLPPNSLEQRMTEAKIKRLQKGGKASNTLVQKPAVPTTKP